MLNTENPTTLETLFNNYQLSTRAWSRLELGGIENLEHLVQLDIDQLLSIRGLGVKTLISIMDTLCIFNDRHNGMLAQTPLYVALRHFWKRRQARERAKWGW